MKELHLNLDGAHEGDKKSIHSRLEKHTLLFYKRECGRESIMHSTTYILELK